MGIIIHAQQIPVILSFILVVTEESIDDQPSCLFCNSWGYVRLIPYFSTVNSEVMKKCVWEKNLMYLLKMDKPKCCCGTKFDPSFMLHLNNCQSGPVRNHPVCFPVPLAQICSDSLETWSGLCSWLTGATAMDSLMCLMRLVHLPEKWISCYSSLLFLYPSQVPHSFATLSYFLLP